MNDAPKLALSNLAHRLIAALMATALILITLSVTGCSGICGNHGGIREYVGNNVYICNDGTRV